MLEHYYWAFRKGISLMGWIDIKFVRMCYVILNYTVKLLVHHPLIYFLHITTCNSWGLVNNNVVNPNDWIPVWTPKADVVVTVPRSWTLFLPSTHQYRPIFKYFTLPNCKPVGDFSCSCQYCIIFYCFCLCSLPLAMVRNASTGDLDSLSSGSPMEQLVGRTALYIKDTSVLQSIFCQDWPTKRSLLDRAYDCQDTG